MNDLRFAFRQLLKNPGFTAVAVLTLALGIGANAVVFSVARAVLFRSLGFEREDRLMWVRLANTLRGTTEDRLSWRDYEDIRDSARSYESVALFGSPGATWEHDGRIEELPALRVTPSLATVLRVRPVLGRMLLPSDSEESAAPVALVSFELWRGRFGGSPDLIGHTIRLNEKIHTIVGVLPPGLQFPVERAPSVGTGSGVTPGVQAFWFPLRVRGEDRVSRGARMFLLVSRLKPGVEEDGARVELAALSRRLGADEPDANLHWSYDLLSFRDQVFGRTRQAIPVLAGAVAAILMICCVNLANLLLARGVARHRELSVRLALGAGRSRLVRTLLMESVLLSLLGGGCGVALADGMLEAVRSLATPSVPFIREAKVDASVVLFIFSLSVLTALLFGFLPALRLMRLEASESLRSGARSTGGWQIRALQHGLLIGQITAVVALLSSAGLLLESFRRLTGLDLGYRPGPVITLDFSAYNLPTNDDGLRLYREIHSRLLSLPGVDAVGTIQSTPLTGKWTFNEKAIAFGRPAPEGGWPQIAATFVGFDYFQVMGIRLREGRLFRASELRGDDFAQVAILNESAARMLFPGERPVGKRFALGVRPDRYYVVIGVVQDTRDVRLEEQPQPRFYLNFVFGGAQFVVRTAAAARTMMPMLNDTLKAFGPRVIIHEIKPMTEIVSATVAERRFLAALLAAYAATALGIAAMGIFGVMSYQVAQRTNEFGIRLALGARPTDLKRLVLRQAGRLALVGLAMGLVLSLGTGRLLASQLFGLSPHDPLLLAAVSVLLLVVGLLASFLPARRATRVDPIEALRHE